MKMGILTHHYIHNHGAVLQAYATQGILSNYFNQIVEIIDYRAPEHDFMDNANIEDFIDYALIKSERVPTDYEKALEFLNDYDVIFVGSDEVWKLEHGKWSKPYPNIYWLHQDLKCKKIALSASANRLVTDNLTVDTRNDIQRKLRSFDLISVRDNHTRNFLNLMGIDCVKTADPAIVYNFPDIGQKKPQYNCIGINMSNKKFKRVKSEFDIPENALLMHLNNLKVDPLLWVKLHKNLLGCISTSYHSAIFALKNNVPLIVRDYDKRYKGTVSKIKDLLMDLDALYCYGDTFIGHDYEKIQNRFDNMTKEYYNFITEVKNVINT